MTDSINTQDYLNPSNWLGWTSDGIGGTFQGGSNALSSASDLLASTQSSITKTATHLCVGMGPGGTCVPPSPLGTPSSLGTSTDPASGASSGLTAPSWLSGLFGRAIIIILGLIFVAVGLNMFRSGAVNISPEALLHQ